MWKNFQYFQYTIVTIPGGTQRLGRLVGPAIAKELTFTAKVIDGEEAYKIGLVNHVVPQNEAGDAAYLKALEVAEQIIPNVSVCFHMYGLDSVVD